MQKARSHTPRDWRRLLLAALLAGIALPARLHASTAPTTPTWALAWGTAGTAPGQVDGPRGMAVDSDGNVYVAELFNSRVEKFNRLGHPLLQFGSNGSGSGQFLAVSGVAVDPSGNVFATDQNANRIEKFSSTGAFLLQWGSAGSGNGQFNQPLAVATDATGYVYVVDFQNHRVQKFTGAGAFLMSWGGYGSSNGQMAQPLDIAIAPGGWVYVLDVGPLGTYRVQKFTSSGTYVAQWGLGLTFDNIATDRLGNVYASNYDTGVIRKYASDGTLLTSWGSSGTGPGQFTGASALAVDAEGNVYVADYLGDRIQKFSGAGVAPSAVEAGPSYLYKFGAPGAGAGQMNGPWATCVDASGVVYVADTNNHRILRFSNNGTFLSAWGSLGSGTGQFDHPSGICMDPASTAVYVVDQYNTRIQKFTPLGAFVSAFGSSGSGNGQFGNPVGVATDAAGNVYVTDFGNSRVEKFTSGGAYLAQWGSAGTGNGQFNGPFGIAVDAHGYVYVVEQGNGRVQKFSSTGVFVDKWRGLSPGPGFLAGPTGVAVDATGNVTVVDYLNSRLQRFSSNGTFLGEVGVPGTGNGQFNSPIGIAADAAGNLYVADTDNSRIQKFVMPPSIATVADVGNDDGRQARVRILRSSADSPGSGVTITGYEVYRRNDPLPGGLLADFAGGRAASPTGVQLAGWTYVGTAPAHGESEYGLVVPTLADANVSSTEYSAFMARAVTSDPFTFFDSAVDHGYSIDNLPPATPAPFLAAYANGATHLHWTPSNAADFATFRLYRGASADFVPGAGNLVTATADTSATDPGNAGGFYKLAAVDRNGNESGYALLGPGQTTDADAVPGVAFAVYGVNAGPSAHGHVTVDFSLPNATPARIELLDVSGRRLGSTDVGALGIGRHQATVVPDATLRAGVYFVRLRQGAASRSMRTVLLP